MKIVCSKSELLKGVNIVLKAIPTKSSMAILECILIDASSDEIKLTANNLDLGIETIIEGNIEERGIIALDAKIFSEIVRKLPENNICIETFENFKTIITCEKSKFNIIGKSGEDFSYLPSIEKNEMITISQVVLRDVIRQTIFCVNEFNPTKSIRGELFKIKENELTVIALDGHQVAIRNIKLKKSYHDHSLVVPARTLIEISKILNGGIDDEVNLYYTNNHVVFEFDKTVVVSRLVEGDYVKIDSLFYHDYNLKFKINKKELLESIDRSTLLSREGDKKPIIVDVKDDCVELIMQSFIGTMDEFIDITEKEGGPLTIAFNPKYFIDALRAIDDEVITLYMINQKAPCFIRDKEDTYTYFVLPVCFNKPKMD